MPHVYATSIAPIAAFQAEFLQDLCQQNGESREGMLLYVDGTEEAHPELMGLEATTAPISPEADGLIQLQTATCTGGVLTGVFANWALIPAPDTMSVYIAFGRPGSLSKEGGAHRYLVRIKAELRNERLVLELGFKTNRERGHAEPDWNGEHYLQVLSAAVRGSCLPGRVQRGGDGRIAYVPDDATKLFVGQQERRVLDSNRCVVGTWDGSITMLCLWDEYILFNPDPAASLSAGVMAAVEAGGGQLRKVELQYFFRPVDWSGNEKWLGMYRRMRQLEAKIPGSKAKFTGGFRVLEPVGFESIRKFTRDEMKSTGHRGNMVGPYTHLEELRPVEGVLGLEILPEGMRAIVNTDGPLPPAALASLSARIGVPLEEVIPEPRKKRAPRMKA